MEVLTKRKKTLERIAGALIEKETIEREEYEKLIKETGKNKTVKKENSYLDSPKIKIKNI
jgi:uncharacterized protein YjbK